MFSLLPTASLLCAFENAGYATLLLLPRGECEDFVLSISGTGMEALLLEATGDVLEDRRSGGVDAFSTFREDLEDLWRVFSFDLGVSASLSRSFSRGFEGILVAVKRGEGSKPQ